MKEKTKKNSFRTKAFRAGGYSSAAAAIVILIAVLINVLVSSVSTAYTNIDTTESGLYSLSQQTKDVISSLEKEVTIYYVASDEYRAGYVTKLLDKFASSGKNLKTENIDPDVEPDFASEYTEDSVANGDLLVVCGDKSQVVHYAEMIEYEAGSYEYYYYYLQNGQVTDVYWNGEVLLLKAIDYVTSDKTYNVYFLDIGGEGDFSALEETLGNVNMICKGITNEHTVVPDDASCLVLSGLSEDLSDKELAMITEHLEKGGKMYIAADLSSDEMPNFKALIASYGLSFTESTIEDGDMNFGSNELLYPQYDSDHAIIAPFTNANYICFPNAMGIETEEKENITVTTLLSSSDSAYLSTDESDALDFKVFTLGVIADNAANGSQIVLYGTTEYTSSEYIEDSTIANSDLFINSVGYLCDKDSAVTIHAKAVTSDATLDFSNTSTGMIVAVIAIIPALASVCVGFVIWYRRRNS